MQPSLPQRIMKINHHFRLHENKPNQSQSLVKDLIALVNAWMFISKTVKKSCARLWALLQCFSENFDKPGELMCGCKSALKLRNRDNRDDP